MLISNKALATIVLLVSDTYASFIRTRELEGTCYECTMAGLTGEDIPVFGPFKDSPSSSDQYASIENLGNAGSVLTILNDAGATDWTENYDATCNTSTQFCYGSTVEFSVVNDPAQHYALLSHSSSAYYIFTLGCVCPTETPTTYPSLYPSSTPTEAFFTDDPMDTDDEEDDGEDNNSEDDEEDEEDLFSFLSILSLFLCI